jgi:hypothetical protein
MGFLDWLLGRDGDAGESAEPAAPPQLATAPTADDVAIALTRVEALVGDGAVPAVVRSRALRVTDLVRRALPRLGLLGVGSYDSYAVVATATDYLPEAIGAYLRLPRDWADSRPVEGGKTSLLLLVDQLDLLGATMEKVYDAANRTDAEALITHGRFLQERFGHGPVLPAAPPVRPTQPSANPLDLGQP